MYFPLKSDLPLFNMHYYHLKHCLCDVCELLITEIYSFLKIEFNIENIKSHQTLIKRVINLMLLN